MTEEKQKTKAKKHLNIYMADIYLSQERNETKQETKHHT